MHKSVQAILKNWCYNHSITAKNNVADLGSYNINGCVRDIIPHAVGFDITPGINVDFVVEPGIIPEEHHHRYEFVTAISSFQCCPRSDLFKQEILDLLVPGGYLLLTMCAKDCVSKHSTSPNSLEFDDSIRMSVDQLEAFFQEEFEIQAIYQVSEHPDLILKAKKR